MLKSEQILSVQFNDFSQSNLHPLKKYIATSPKAPILGPSQTLHISLMYPEFCHHDWCYLLLNFMVQCFSLNIMKESSMLLCVVLI